LRSTPKALNDLGSRQKNNVADLPFLLKQTSLAVFLSATFLGCSSEADPDGTLALEIGQEDGAWSAAPAAATVQVDMVQAGVHTTLATVPAATDSIGLGSGGPENVQASFEATAFDAQQNPIMHGVTPTFSLQGFVDTQFYVFLGRTGFSRPSGSLVYEHRHPLLTVWPNEYLFITGTDTAGADPTNLDVYDVAFAAVLQQEPNFPQGTTSIVVSGTTLLMLSDTTNIWFDLSSSTSETATSPEGLAFSEVSGGRTLIAPSGTEYLVGSTRQTGDPTDKVLEVDADGTLHTLVLSVPRLGAAASFVEGNLVVAGGSATGAGADVLAPGASTFTALGLPADATQGAGLAELTPTSAILVGGQDPTSGAASPMRSIDITCTSACMPTPLGSLDLTLGLTQVFPVATTELLVVGETSDAVTHAFSLDVSSASPVATEQAFREPRAGASSVMLTNGQVAVVGGDDPTSGAGLSSLELFFP
jgi:hypothetical protein